MSNKEQIDVKSLLLHEELRQVEGQCISCDLINAGATIKIELDDKKLLCIKGHCPVCGKRIKDD